jgi:hypothetical protein
MHNFLVERPETWTPKQLVNVTVKLHYFFVSACPRCADHALIAPPLRQTSARRHQPADVIAAMALLASSADLKSGISVLWRKRHMHSNR